MKLIGSLAEQSCREELSRSWDMIRGRNNNLLSMLELRLGLIRSAFVLSWLPEQSEDLYTILVNGLEVIWLEVLRQNGEVVSFKALSVKEYERSIRSRQNRIKLAVALDLAGKL